MIVDRPVSVPEPSVNVDVAFVIRVAAVLVVVIWVTYVEAPVTVIVGVTPSMIVVCACPCGSPYMTSQTVLVELVEFETSDVVLDDEICPCCCDPDGD